MHTFCLFVCLFDLSDTSRFILTNFGHLRQAKICLICHKLKLLVIMRHFSVGLNHMSYKLKSLLTVYNRRPQPTGMLAVSLAAAVLIPFQQQQVNWIHQSIDGQIN